MPSLTILNICYDVHTVLGAGNMTHQVCTLNMTSRDDGGMEVSVGAGNFMGVGKKSTTGGRLATCVLGENMGENISQKVLF